jgi:hypothetical protein
MANLEIEIGAVTDGLQKGLQEAESKLQSFSKSAIAIGKTLSLAVTAPLTGLAAVGLRNFDRQVQAIGQIETALISTGNAAGKTSEQLQKTASELQNISTFGDEEILQKVTSQLLTFTNIAGNAFDRTQKAALDLATRLGGDLQGATIQLGKALNDPVANLSALSRSGIQFSKDQKELINSLVETNRLADAQTIILDELEKQYGGSAEAAAKLGLGPLKQLSNQFGDLLEDVGKIIAEALIPLIEKVSRVITFFQNLSDSTKKVIVAVGAVVAAIGPLLVVFGSIGLALPAITAGFTALGAAVTFATGPFGLIAAAVVAATALIFKLNNELKRTSEIAGEVRAANLAETTKNISKEVDDLAVKYKEINPQLSDFEAKQKAVNSVLESYQRELQRVKDTDAGNLNRIIFLNDQIEAIKSLRDGTKNLTDTTVNLNDTAKLTFEEFSKIADLANQKVFAQFDKEAREFNEALKETIDLQRRLEGFANQALSGLNKEIQDFGDLAGDTAPITEIADELESLGEKTRFLANDFQLLGASIGNSLSNAVGSFGPFLSQFLSFAGRLIDANFKISTSNAISGATSAAKATGPAAVLTLPAFIAGAVGLIASAFSGIRGGRGGSSTSGTSGVGSGVGQSFSGVGVAGAFSNNVNVALTGGFTIEGEQLRYVLNKNQEYRN